MWEELKNAREGKGLSQVDLGHLAEISGATISAWENKIPSPFAKLKRLCEELGVSPNCLLGWQVDETDAAPNETEQGSIVSHCTLFNEDICDYVMELLAEKDASLRKRLASGHIDTDTVEEINHNYDVLAALESQRGIAPSERE